MTETDLTPTDADRGHDLRAALDALDRSPYGMVSLTDPIVRAALVRALHAEARASYAEQRADELQRLLDAIAAECDREGAPVTHFKRGTVLSLADRVGWAIWLGPAAAGERCSADQDRCRELLAEVERLQDMVRGLADRVAAQSELLSQRAERQPDAATGAEQT